MPERGWKDVRGWRDRADELRQTAEGMTIPSAQDSLILAAERFERMADALERHLRARGIVEPERD
jgi:HAMP domain-containing protein